MIGIICAMEIESRQLVEQLEDSNSQKIGRLEFIAGKLRGTDVVIAMAGVGKVNAAMCTQTMILKYAPSLIINSGVAGSLSPRLGIGDIAVGTGVVEHDFDTTAVGDPPAYFSELDGDTFPCDVEAAAGILEAAQETEIRAFPAKIASGDQFISDGTTKARLVEQFGAEACEMEAGAIAHVCYNNGVKCAVIRAISDSTDGEHQVEFQKFLPVAARNSATLVTRFLESLH